MITAVKFGYELLSLRRCLRDEQSTIIQICFLSAGMFAKSTGALAVGKPSQAFLMNPDCEIRSRQLRELSYF